MRIIPQSAAISKVNTTDTGDLIRCGISRAFHNKELVSGDARAFGNSFIPSEITPEKLITHILAGRAWTPGYFDGCTRKNDTFIQAELIALDFDENVSVAQCVAVPFIRQYALLIHPSASSSPEKYKTRVIFRTDAPMTDPEQYRLYAMAICRHLGLPADPVSYKPAQLYYGSTNRTEHPIFSEGGES
jgi:hypothetical protein